MAQATEKPTTFRISMSSRTRLSAAPLSGQSGTARRPLSQSRTGRATRFSAAPKPFANSN